MNIVLPFPPSANFSTGGRDRKFRYRKRVSELLSGYVSMIGDLYIAVRFFPKNIYRHGDIDNLMKTLLDAMKGHVFFDDSQVRSMYVIMEDSCTESPRVDVRIQPHSKQKPSCLRKHREDDNAAYL